MHSSFSSEIVLFPEIATIGCEKNMADFISTTDGKIVNVDAIAFLTSRQPASEKGAKAKRQLIVGFSSAANGSQGGLVPLSLVLEGKEATDFLGQLSKRGADVASLKKKIG